MARTVNEIFTDMLATKAAEAGLNGLTSTSLVSVWRLVFYVVAVCAWSLEKLWDIFKAEVLAIIATMRPHTPGWYVEKAKAFQYGYSLVAEKDYYDNTGIADDVVAASKIVKFAAMPEEPFLRLKVAKLVGTDLAKLSTTELNSFKAYIARIKDAGVKLNTNTITSTDPDELRVVCRVKYDPLVLTSTGARIDGAAATPVPDAMRSYLYNIDFNGLFSTQKLEAAMLAVDGVSDIKIDQIQRKYGLLPFTSVDIDFVPDAGYLKLQDVNLTITYIPA